METKVTSENSVFTDTYMKFTNLYFKTMVEEEDELKIPEKVIRCIWNDQIFKDKALRTTQGKALEVIFPGYWNFGPGPDFKKATIKVNDEIYEGDVELHVYGTDWKAHKHSENNDFDNVILHVFMWRGRGEMMESAPPSNQGGKTFLSRPHIYELEIKNFLKKGIIKLNKELDFDNYPTLNKFNYGLCHSPLSRLSQPKLTHLLNAAGDARIFTKMERYHDNVITRGYEQTFYEGLAEALGYPNNKKPFQTLAENLPIASIKEVLSTAPKNADKALLIQALLFGVSGLIEFKSLDIESLLPEDRKYFDRIQRLWKKHKAPFMESRMSPGEWKFGGMRPANFPYRRIAGLSYLLVNHLNQGVFADYLDNLKSAISIAGDKGYTAPTRKAFDFFCVAAKGYWASHYSPGGKTLLNPQQLIGQDRSREITVNICIPLGIIYARASKSEALETALGLLFEVEKKPTDNKWIRFMKHYILGNKKEMVGLLTSDKRTQGLMQVYQDFCTKNENNCLRCNFPGVVERFFS